MWPEPKMQFCLNSVSYEQTAISYVWKNDEDTLRKSPSLTTLNAYLISNHTVTCPVKSSWRGECADPHLIACAYNEQ
jgi:hypothetical protein